MKPPTGHNNAVLLGASGLVGGFCLQALLGATQYTEIVLLNRRPLTIAPDPRLTQKTISFENLGPRDFSDAKDVYCALGTTIRKAGSQAAFRRVDLEYPLAAARAARQVSAEQFVLVSSVGADPRSKNFYLRTKGELEQQIGQLGFRALHIFRPSLLLGTREESRPGEALIKASAPLLCWVMFGGLRRYRPIPAQTVGRAMVAAAQRGDSGNFVYEHDDIVRLVG